jgi:hypothetical protein
VEKVRETVGLLGAAIGIKGGLELGLGLGRGTRCRYRG